MRTSNFVSTAFSLCLQSRVGAGNVAAMENSTPKAKYWKDPASALTHFAGFLAAVVGLIVLWVQTPGPAAKTASFIIYGTSLALLFLSSSAYHFFDLGEDRNLLLRRLDHSAIFLLIGGTYVPPIVHLLEGSWRTGMLTAIGVIAALGVLFKLTWFHAPRWIDAALYLAMGWIVFIPGKMIIGPMSTETLVWMCGGGAFYTVGAVIYATKWPDPWPDTFGFHDVWHLFVLAGAGAHFGFVYSLMDVQIP